MDSPCRIALGAQAIATPEDADDETDGSSRSEASDFSEPGSSKVEGTNLDEVKGFAFGAPEQTAAITRGGFEIKVAGPSQKTIDQDGDRDRSHSEALTKPEPYKPKPGRNRSLSGGNNGDKQSASPVKGVSKPIMQSMQLAAPTKKKRRMRKRSSIGAGVTEDKPDEH